MTGSLGYDLDRVVELRYQTIWAIAALRELRSDDPAAAALGQVVADTHRVLDDHWMAAVTEIVRSDPLAGHSTPMPGIPVGMPRQAERSLTIPPGAHDDENPFAGSSDADLLAELDRLDVDLPYSDDFRPDFNDAVWESFDELAEEIAARSVDPGFADLLTSRFPSNPLVGLVAHFASIPPDVALTLLGATLASTSHVDDVRTHYDAAAADALLRSLTEHPGAALDLVLEPGDLHELLVWPFLDAGTVAEVLLTGLLVPTTDPSRLGDGHEVLRHLVAFTNDPYVDRTRLRTPLPAALAAGIALYLPDFIASIEPGDQVNLRGIDGRNVGAPLGSHEEVLDLLGSIMRDPDGAAALLAALGESAGSAASGTVGYDLADVGDFALALAAAAENERLEDEMHSAAVGSIVAQAVVVVGLTAGAAVAATGLGPTARSILSGIVRSGGEAAADRVRSDAGNRHPRVDTAAAAEAAIEFSLFETFLDGPDRFADSAVPIDTNQLVTARQSLDRVRELATRGAPLVDIERELQNVRVEIVALGGHSFVSTLDNGSIRALDTYDPDQVDLDHRLD